MSDGSEEAVISSLVTGIRARLEEALSIAKAAESCADSGSPEQATKILMDYEPFANEAQDMFKAALAIKRNLLGEGE